MKVVEVSAIKEATKRNFAAAISPCGRFYYNTVSNGRWFEYEFESALDMFNIHEGKVHRGIFKIKVVED